MSDFAHFTQIQRSVPREMLKLISDSTAESLGLCDVLEALQTSLCLRVESCAPSYGLRVSKDRSRSAILTSVSQPGSSPDSRCHSPSFLWTAKRPICAYPGDRPCYGGLASGDYSPPRANTVQIPQTVSADSILKDVKQLELPEKCEASFASHVQFVAGPKCLHQRSRIRR